MTYREAFADFERKYWQRLYERHHGIVSAVAKAAGANRTHTYRVLNRLQITSARPRNTGNTTWQSLGR